MKDASSADAAPEPVSSAARALDFTRAKKLLNWKQKMSLEENLKKATHLYISTREPKGALMRKCSWSA